MRHRTAFLIALSILVAACQSGSAPTTTSVALSEQLPDHPELAVDQMVAALMLNDLEEIRALTSDHQLAIIVSLEGGTQDELVAMIGSGVPDDVAANFWTAFIEGLPELVGATVQDMEFGSSIPQNVEGVEFMSFPVGLGTGTAGTEWFVRLTEDGWQVDLIATFAAPFSSALESLFKRTSDPKALEVFRGEAASIEAAYSRHRELGSSDRVQEALQSLLETLSS